MKKVLITGANKSIGYETARQLAAQGYFIYLGSRSLKNGLEAVARLKAEGLENTEAVEIDISDAMSIEAARKRIDALDILINNAGISGGFPQAPTLIDTDVIRTVFETNFFGTINVTKAFLDLLQKSAEPRIVNVTTGLSSLTLQSDPNWKYYNFRSAAYAPSKTALNAYTIALAHELKDSAFKINVVDPGYTATDFNSHRGTGSVESAAALIARYAMLDAAGPTGKFFSNDIDSADRESPW
jgi:NAD(P)-dependent dehydrogenase (short-subunit alcohol dehydrogenase family)